MKERILNAVLGLTGLLVLAPGIIEILLPLTGGSFAWGVVGFRGDFGLWRGLILIASGTFFLLAIDRTDPVQKRAQAVLASSMIWIVGGVEIFSLLLSSIPGGEGRWINSVSGFLRGFTGPFIPSIFLLPVSVLTVGLALTWGKSDEQAG